MLLNKNNIDEIISTMTIDEKLAMLVGGQGFSSLGMDKYGITEMAMCDSHNGINLMQRVADIVGKVMQRIGGSGKKFAKNEVIGHLFAIGTAIGGVEGTVKLLQGKITEEEYKRMPENTEVFAREFVKMLPEVLPGGHCPTCFPAGMNMGSTWDTALMYECGEKVGAEARAYGIDILLAPTINIQRDPKCGRWFESYSEDPCVMGEMVVPYIKGVQSNGVLTTVKHYACNNQETLRHEIDEIISERALREIYLPAFKKATIDGDSKCLMTAYNSVNGEFASQNNHLLKDVLRDDWGYDGLVISDWNGVYDKVEALKAGNNLEMPGPNSQERLKIALEKGEITEEIIDKNLRYVLKAVTQSNAFNKVEAVPFDVKGHSDFSKKMAEDSIILLKNENVLPLKKTSKVAVFGDFAKKTLACGTGSSGIISDYVVSILEGMQAKFDSVKFFDEIEEDLNDFSTILMVIGENIGEGADRKTLEIDAKQKEQVLKLIDFKTKHNLKLVVALNTPAPVEIYDIIDNFDSLVYVGFAGQEVGHAFANILSGEVNPSAKTTFTYPKKYIDTPTFLNYPGEFLKHIYGEGIYVGYRYYDKKQVEAQFPFGFGLSYTKFNYKEIQFEKEVLDLTQKESLTVKVLVKNDGEKAGSEVVQLYVNDEVSTLDRPIKELKSFAKVYLEPNEEKWVEMKIDENAFSLFDTSINKFVVEPGVYNVEVGGCGDNLVLKKKIEVLSENPYAKNLSTPIKEIIEDGELLSKVLNVLPKGFLEIPGIQIELIYHPELSIGECIDKYVANEFGLTLDEVESYKQKVLEIM